MYRGAKSVTTHYAINPLTGLGSWQYQETFVAKEKDKWMVPSRDCSNRQNTFHECSSALDPQWSEQSRAAWPPGVGPGQWRGWGQQLPTLAVSHSDPSWSPPGRSTSVESLHWSSDPVEKQTSGTESTNHISTELEVHVQCTLISRLVWAKMLLIQAALKAKNGSSKLNSNCYTVVSHKYAHPFTTLASVQNAGGLIHGMRQFLSQLRPPFW